MKRFLQQVVALGKPPDRNRLQTPALEVQTHLKAGRDDSRDRNSKDGKDR
jgi:hypothetical protein